MIDFRCSLNSRIYFHDLDPHFSSLTKYELIDTFKTRWLLGFAPSLDQALSFEIDLDLVT